jgi:hypothetical protein
MSANSILSHPLSMSREEKGYLSRTLAAPGDELAAVLDELARHLEEFLGLVHCCWSVWCVWCIVCFYLVCIAASVRSVVSCCYWCGFGKGIGMGEFGGLLVVWCKMLRVEVGLVASRRQLEFELPNLGQASHDSGSGRCPLSFPAFREGRLSQME